MPLTHSPELIRCDLSDDAVLSRIAAFNARRRDTEYLSKPLILLGAGSVIAQPFVEGLIQRFNVIALVDNARAGQSKDGIPYIGDESLLPLLHAMPEAVGILCCGSEKALRHFRNLWGEAPPPLFSWFQVLFDYPSETDRGRLAFLPQFYDEAQVQRQYRAAKELLSDPVSLATLDAVMMYRLTWDDRYLMPVARAETAIYFENETMPLSPDEILADAGAFDGDSIRNFIAHSGGQYRHIHAFELDPANVAAFNAKMADVPNVTLHPLGLWSHPAELKFEPHADLGSHIARPDTTAQTVTAKLDALDNRIESASLIKLDVEGAEIHVLEGARRIISQQKPKLAISAYHLPDDFSMLSDKVLSIRDDYRFKMRHYSPILFDTVLYAF